LITVAAAKNPRAAATLALDAMEGEFPDTTAEQPSYAGCMRLD